MDDYEDFYNKIVAIYEGEDGGDIERTHLEADKLMCEKLRELGYGKAIDYLDNQDMWYA